MKYFVYFLKSSKNGDVYVGSTMDVSNRFALHNAGSVKSTKGYRPRSQVARQKSAKLLYMGSIPIAASDT